MGKRKHLTLRSVLFLTGMFLLGNVKTIAAEKSASFRVNLTIIRGCTLSLTDYQPVNSIFTANASMVPQLECGKTFSANHAVDISTAADTSPAYQLSSDSSQKIFAVTF